MSRKASLNVRGPDGTRPFLRGMLTHSLLKQGLTFKEAYSVANAVRQRLPELADRPGEDVEVSAKRLRKLVNQIISETYGAERLNELGQESPRDEPLVEDPEGTVPFSRGLLSQKLIGTGLEPRLAYEVAQEVWVRLRQLPGSRIEGEALRQLAREIVVERQGEAFGKRYDVIEHIDSSNRPIVVLIGGATGCGKSTLATEIAYRLGIRKIASTDMIREIMRKLLSSDILPAIHSSSYLYRARHAADDPILGGYLEQVLRVEVGIAASIRRAVVENFHLIVEGVHVVAPWRVAAEFEKSALIVPVILATLDRTGLESRFVRRGKEKGGQRRSKRYLKSLDDIMRIQDFILEQADLHDVPILENVSFDEAANDLLQLITDYIHRVGGLDDRPSS